MVSIGAIGPGTPLLILDLGRPGRFLHMMRIFKLRSPMSTGAWCLSAFSGVMGSAIAADLLGRPRIARVLRRRRRQVLAYRKQSLTNCSTRSETHPDGIEELRVCIERFWNAAGRPRRSAGPRCCTAAWSMM